MKKTLIRRIKKLETQIPFDPAKWLNTCRPENTVAKMRALTDTQLLSLGAHLEWLNMERAQVIGWEEIRRREVLLQSATDELLEYFIREQIDWAKAEQILLQGGRDG